MKTNLTKLAALLAVAFFTAAAQAASQNDPVASGQAAIINALVAGATVYAPEELRQARQILDLSRGAIAQNDLNKAMRLASMASEAARAAEAKAMQLRNFLRTASH